MIVYKTTNKINGKIYIGFDTNNNPNYLGSGVAIKKAIRKYGKENFIKETIEYCDTKNQLTEKEIYWIKFYNSTDRKIGYNISIGGGEGGNLGKKVNKRISISNKGKNIGNQNAKGKIPYNKGKKMPDEQIKKLLGPKSLSHKENIKKAREKLTQEGKIGKKIICLNNNKIYNTLIEASKELKLTSPNINLVLKGKNKNTKGYVFKYYINGE